jgi:hypothetical protein
MSPKDKSEVINVRISRRVLWIGGDAYPLQNIARAQTLQVTPPRETPIREYIKSVAGWVFLGIGVTIVLNIASMHASTLVGLLWLAILAALVVRTFKLISALRNRKQTYYALVIETAGTPNTALVSPDSGVVFELVQEIMAAIDNPQAEYSQQVTNVHLGDKITQFGNDNVGKISR